eukprot:1606016-Amphidinium_carterae.1
MFRHSQRATVEFILEEHWHAACQSVADEVIVGKKTSTANTSGCLKSIFDHFGNSSWGKRLHGGWLPLAPCHIANLFRDWRSLLPDMLLSHSADPVCHNTLAMASTIGIALLAASGQLGVLDKGQGHNGN